MRKVRYVEFDDFDTTLFECSMDDDVAEIDTCIACGRAFSWGEKQKKVKDLYGVYEAQRCCKCLEGLV